MFRKVVEDFAPGCVLLCRVAGEKTLDAIGTAFICHANGYLMTAAHTFALTDRLVLVPPSPINSFNPSSSSNLTAIKLIVAQYDAVNDVALLKIESGVAGVVPSNLFGDVERVPVGSSVCYLGYPHANRGQYALKASGTILSSKVLSPAGVKQVVVDSMAEVCNSGGPLIDLASNKIIGIMSGRFSPAGNTSSIMIGNHALGTESTLSYASSIEYGLALFQAEGLHA